jgi:hypothetical protein
LTAHCDAARGATFAPVAEALRQLLPSFAERGRAGEWDAAREEMRAEIEAAIPVAAAERTRIAGGVADLLAGSPASPEETFYVVRRLLTLVAATKPVLLAIDDLHWAEPLLLDLVEHLVQWGSGARLLILAGARPELRDLRASLAVAGGVVAEVVTLGGLDGGAATRLAANVIGAADLPAAVAVKVLAISEGNPLFVGELVRMLVQEGALTRDGERWIVGANLAALEMPPTIQALLAARIERLRSEERDVLERAAVVGRHFSRAAVAALLAGDANDLDARLEALRRAELIEPDVGRFLGEPVLRFHHVLIRDAAYRRLLKDTRVELHERLAGWIEARAGGAGEHDETVGWHLEQAHQHLRELGALDARGKRLGERAASCLAAAGRRALARDDVARAASLLGRAIDCLDTNDPARADLALDWCEALLSAGDVGLAAHAIDQLGRFSALADPGRPNRTAHDRRLSAWHTCFAGQLTALTASRALQSTADTVAAAAEELARLDDAAGEAKAHSVHAQALARLGKVGACEAALDKALAAARKAGDRRRANAVLAGAPLAALWGPSPVTRASGRCLDVVRVLRITQGAPAVEAVALSCQSVLEALRGRSGAARRMIASSRAMVEELGIAHRLFDADVFAGRIDLIEGDSAAAEVHLRGAYHGLRELGLGIDAARAGALLARSLLAQGRVAEGERLSEQSEALAGDDLQAAIAWRGVRAEALAHRGEGQAAVELARSAVDIAAATDALLDHADARLALAVALRAAGRDAEADAEERRAIELWEAKGATVLAERAQRQPLVQAETSAGGALTESRDAGTSDERIGAGRQTAADSGAPFNARAAQLTAARRTREPMRRWRPNVATEYAARLDAAIRARDVEAVRALFTAKPIFDQYLHAVAQGHHQTVEALLEVLGTGGLVCRQVPFATLGEALALCRFHYVSDDWVTHDFEASPTELELIVLIEATPDARASRIEMFMPDHLGDAIARLYQRHAGRLDIGPERERAVATAQSVAKLVAPPDMTRYASALAPDLEFVDHRTVGFATGRGAEALLRGFGSLLEAATNVTTRVVEVLALEPNQMLLRWMTSGTDRVGGGVFESTFMLLWKFGPDGRVVRDETFDDGHETEALARFDALATDLDVPDRRHRPAVPGADSTDEASAGFDERSSDPLRIPSNAATRTVDRILAWIERGNWEALRDVCWPIEFDDRRRLFRTSGDREQFVANCRFIREAGMRPTRTVLAAPGDGLELHRMLWSSDRDGRRSVVETLEVIEVDGDGRVVRAIIFDPDDRRAASAELVGRYASSATGQRLPAGVFEALQAVNSHDIGRLHAALPPDFVIDDHRRTGLGRLEGADRYVDSAAALFEQAPEVIVEVLYVVGLHERGVLTMAHAFGTLPDGGQFEIVYLWLAWFEGERLVATEMFEPEDIDLARRRFESRQPPEHKPR